MRSARQQDRSRGLTIAVSAVSVAVVTVAVSNSGLIRDWPEGKSVLGDVDAEGRQPAPTAQRSTSAAETALAAPPVASEAEPSAYLIALPDPEPTAELHPQPAASDPAPHRDFAASFANLPQPSEPMALAAEPVPTVLLFDSTAFVARPPAVVTPPVAARAPSPDPVALALANAASQPQAELVWTRPPLAEMPPAIALAEPLPPILSDPLARVEGVAPVAFGEPISPPVNSDFTATPAQKAGVTSMDRGPSFQEAAVSFATPALEAVEGISAIAVDAPAPAAPVQDEALTEREQSARLRRELSTSLARLRDRQTRPVREEAKQTSPADQQPGSYSASVSAPAAFEQSSVKVMSDGTPLGSAAIMVDENQMVSIQLSELISLFEDHLDKPLFVWLKNSAAASQFATLDTLRSAGIDADYDADTAQVSLSLTPER